MAKPKPAEDTDLIGVRVPLSLGKKLRALADQSNNGMGMTVNRYCNAIMANAAENEITINEVQRFELSGSLAGVKEAVDKAQASAEKLGKVLQAAQTKRKKPKSNTRRSA
ncbi:MAG: hypothetical protein QM496_13790 [Verrucomicrobiota bacterium]